MKGSAAIAAALRACGFRCVECGSDQTRLDYLPAAGWCPIVVHWKTDDGWCLVLAGGPAARRADWDLLEALAAALAPLADYGELVSHEAAP